MSKAFGISPEETASSAAITMNENGIGALVVVQNEKPVGILTDRHLVQSCIGSGIEALNRQVKNLMCSEVKSVRVDYGIIEILDGLRNSELPFLAVVDKVGKAVGIASYPDLLELLGQELIQASGHENVSLVETVERAA